MKHFDGFTSFTITQIQSIRKKTDSKISYFIGIFGFFILIASLTFFFLQGKESNIKKANDDNLRNYLYILSDNIEKVSDGEPSPVDFDALVKKVNETVQAMRSSETKQSNLDKLAEFDKIWAQINPMILEMSKNKDKMKGYKARIKVALNNFSLLKKEMVKDDFSKDLISALDSTIEFLFNLQNNTFSNFDRTPLAKIKGMEIDKKKNAESYNLYIRVINNGDLDSVENLVRSKAEIKRVQDIVVIIKSNITTLISPIRDLSESHRSLDTANYLWLLSALVGLLFMVGAMSYHILLLSYEEKRKSEAARMENEKNLTSVRKLLSDIQGLGEGDLTKRASIKNGITHQIAMFLNTTVEELQRLVGDVRTTGDKVQIFTDKTVALSEELGASANDQVFKIDDVSRGISGLARELEDVVQNAYKSLELATSAFDLSSTGKDVIRETKERMDTVRDTIQETAKRIKGLGELSQEVGQVIQIIRDVGAKTQVLSLNAAIQSANAGDVGKGFNVVAEEVEALAKESAESANKINHLIQTIQSSIKEAIFAMESTTKTVVEGAIMADKAGNSLVKINKVAEEMKLITDSMALKTQEGNESITTIALKINNIKKFTEMASNNAKDFKEISGLMSNSSTSLLKSIHRFKLTN